MLQEWELFFDNAFTDIMIFLNINTLVNVKPCTSIIFTVCSKGCLVYHVQNNDWSWWKHLSFLVFYVVTCRICGHDWMTIMCFVVVFHKKWWPGHKSLDLLVRQSWISKIIIIIFKKNKASQNAALQANFVYCALSLFSKMSRQKLLYTASHKK